MALTPDSILGGAIWDKVWSGHESCDGRDGHNMTTSSCDKRWQPLLYHLPEHWWCQQGIMYSCTQKLCLNPKHCQLRVQTQIFWENGEAKYIVCVSGRENLIIIKKQKQKFIHNHLIGSPKSVQKCWHWRYSWHPQGNVGGKAWRAWYQHCSQGWSPPQCHHAPVQRNGINKLQMYSTEMKYCKNFYCIIPLYRNFTPYSIQFFHLRSSKTLVTTLAHLSQIQDNSAFINRIFQIMVHYIDVCHTTGSTYTKILQKTVALKVWCWPVNTSKTAGDHSTSLRTE